MKIELTPQKFIDVVPENEDEDIYIGLEEIHSFELYADTTLAEVLGAIDEHPDYHDFDNDQLLEEMEYEGSFDELMDEPLSLISRLYIQMFLEKINKEALSSYPKNKVYGEETLYGMIILEDEKADKEAIKRLESLTKSIEDLTEGEFEKTLKRKDWETSSDMFYVIRLTTYY